MLLGGGVGVWVHLTSKVSALEKDIDFFRQLRTEDKKEVQAFIKEIRDDMREIKDGINNIKIDLQNKADKL
jgi:hypothetical protein